MSKPTYKPVPPGQAVLCESCGCPVVDAKTHDEWHSRMDGIDTRVTRWLGTVDAPPSTT